MLAIYTVALYRVEPGSIGPWEVLLYIWVLVSQVKLPALFHVRLFVGCGSNGGDSVGDRVHVGDRCGGGGERVRLQLSRALNPTIPLDVPVAYHTCYCGAWTITTQTMLVFLAVGIPPPSRTHPTTPQSMCFSEVATGVWGGVGDADTERREGGTAAEPLGQRHRVKRSRRRGSLCCCSSPFLGGKFSTAVLMAAMMCRLGDYVQVGISLQLSW